MKYSVPMQRRVGYILADLSVQPRIMSCRFLSYRTQVCKKCPFYNLVSDSMLLPKRMAESSMTLPNRMAENLGRLSLMHSSPGLCQSFRISCIQCQHLARTGVDQPFGYQTSVPTSFPWKATVSCCQGPLDPETPCWDYATHQARAPLFEAT